MSATWIGPGGSTETCLRWNEIRGDVPLPVPAAAFCSGRTHHELLLIEVGSAAAPMPPGRRVGLYQFGLKVADSDDDLREVVRHLTEHGVPIQGPATTRSPTRSTSPTPMGTRSSSTST